MTAPRVEIPNLGVRSPADVLLGQAAGFGDCWYPAGELYGTPALTQNAVTLDTLFAMPFFTGPGGVCNGIAASVQAFIASAQGRFGIYTSNPAPLFTPGRLLFDSGIVALTSNGVKATAVTPPLIFPSNTLLWCVALFGTAAPTMHNVMAAPVPIFGFASPINRQVGWQSAFVFAALPDPFPTPVLSITNLPLVMLRFA